MVTSKRTKKQRGGDEQTLNVLQTTPLSALTALVEDFEVYNKLLQEECYLIFEQLHATGQFLSSSSISEYETEFNEKSFSDVRSSFDSFMQQIEEPDGFVMTTVFADASNTNTNTQRNVTTNTQINPILGGGIDIDLSMITEENVGSFSTRLLLATYNKHRRTYQTLSPQDQHSLTLCITEYQVQAMAALNKLYLSDVGVTCMMYGAIANIEGILSKEKTTQNGGDLSEWMKSSAVLARQSADMLGKSVRDAATTASQAGKTFFKVVNDDVEAMPLDKKLHILQNLFIDLLKWGGKQVMLRLRAPEFNVAAVSDMASFKKEILSFIGNRIDQIMRKSKLFRNDFNQQNHGDDTKTRHLAWVLSVLENIDSLLAFAQTLSEIALPSSPMNASVKYDIRASLETGVQVKLEPSQWLKEVGKSVDDLKSIVNEQKGAIDNILGIRWNIENARKAKKEQEVNRQLALLAASIKMKQNILRDAPDNKVIGSELGRLQQLYANLDQEKDQKYQEVEQTCVQLLQEIHMCISSMNIPNLPSDIIPMNIIRQLAVKVDRSAFTSVASNTAKEIASKMTKVEAGMRSYFGCISKYMGNVPNINNLCRHIGFSLPDLHNLIAKIGDVGGVLGKSLSSLSTIASHSGAYIQAIDACLLLIHLIVAASLNCRNKTLNRERVTLDDIKRASQERMSKSTSVSQSTSFLPKIGTRGGKCYKKVKRGGGEFNDNFKLPPLMYQQNQTWNKRSAKNFDAIMHVEGHKAVLNERVKKLTITLLAPNATKDMILSALITKSMNSSQLLTSIDGLVNTYMFANEQTLGNNNSVLENLKKQISGLSTPRDGMCNTSTTQLSLEEDIYVLSMFARYQGQQMREQFDITQKPSRDLLYCLVSQNITLGNERNKKIVASIVNNFNGDIDISNATIGGGKKRAQNKQIIKEFLEKKATKDLYAYAVIKKLNVNQKMRKRELIQAVLDM